ncbi:MAG: tetratricopeptide repeat protein [Deltaproteobacteria bacterium]|nr:tetratricopeptide repeat protein [Deltaproteobacteria bacterium]
MRPRVTWAAPSSEAQARALFQKAEVHFNLGEFEQALALYAEAYRLKPLPGFLFNIAQCHRFMEHFEDAAFSYRVYLDRAPQASNRAEVEALVAQMDQQAAARTTAPASTEVAPPPAPPPPPPPAVAQAAKPPVAPVASTVSPWFWPTLAAGAVFVGAGVITGQMASNRSASYRDPSTPVTDRPGLKDSGESLATASLVCLGAGGVALAAAAGLWFWAPATAETTQVAAAPVAGGGVLMMKGAF